MNYHSITCWSDECDGWYCDCACHDDEPQEPKED